MHQVGVLAWDGVVPEERIVTFVTGAVLALLGPWLAWRLPRWEGPALGALAWFWGWSRILLAMSWTGEVWLRIAVYFLIATVAVGFACAAVIGLQAPWRRAAVAASLLAGVVIEVWYAVDHDAFLAGDIAGVSVIFPLVLIALAATGLAAISKAKSAGSYLLLGTGMLALPAFRGTQLGLSLMLSPYWDTPIAKMETALFVVTMAFVVAGVAHLDRRNRSDPAWLALALGVAGGLAVILMVRTYEGPYNVHILFLADGIAAAAGALGLLFHGLRQDAQVAETGPRSLAQDPR